VNPDLERLIALQNLDSKINQSKTKLTVIPAERKQIETRFDEFSATYNKARTSLEQAQAQHRQLSRELEEVQAHHEKYKKDLMKVRNDKEYTVCLREIDSTKKAASLLETQILQLMEEIEKLDKEVAQYSPEVENRRRIADKELAECDEEMGILQKEIDEHVAERQKILVSVPRPLLSRYERIMQRSGSGLAEAKANTCTACRMKIRPQIMSDIRLGEAIIECESCSRILYYIAPTESSAASAE